MRSFQLQGKILQNGIGVVRCRLQRENNKGAMTMLPNQLPEPMPISLSGPHSRLTSLAARLSFIR